MDLNGKSCECGCGHPAPLARRSRGGVKRGQPLRFIHGHNRRGVPALHLRADITERYEADPDTGCWNWTGYITKTGYGQVHLAGVCMNAHRGYWLFLGRTIPDGYELDHLCSNRRCVNPDHMEPVTPQENSRRRRANKLDHKSVKEILGSGLGAHVLADKFGVTAHHIRAIRRGAAWAESSAYDRQLDNQLGVL